MNEVFIAPDIERLAQTYYTLHDSPTAQTNDDVKVLLENVLPADIPQWEQNLMSLPELTSEKVIKLQKNDTFCKNIMQHIGCNRNDNCFIDAIGVLHKKVGDLNSVFLAIVAPQILIPYLLHASHDSLGHVAATKLYHFLKWLYYFKGMRRKLCQYVRS